MLRMVCGILKHESVVAVLVLAAVTLHGCGGGGGSGGGTTASPAPSPTQGPAPAPFPSQSKLKDLFPIRAVTYKSLPNRDYQVGDPLPARDMMQEGYKAQWSADGRDDLGTISALGANAVQIEAAIGLEHQKPHGDFLDRAAEVGLNVIAGYFTQMLCPKWDCYDSWKSATTTAFTNGFAKEKKWHPTIKMLVIAKEPDYCNFGGQTGCDPDTGSCSEKIKNKCWLQAILSAVDGVLAAEKEMGLSPDDPNLPNMTVVWSASSRDSVDGKIKDAVGYFGFRDTQIAFSDPEWIGYKPKSSATDLRKVFANRWTNACEGFGGFDFIQGKVGPNYKPYHPMPWMILRFDLNDVGVPLQIEADLAAMDNYAKQPGTYFAGASLYLFTKDQSTNGTDAGIFGLGAGKSIPGFPETGSVCEEDARTGTQVCKTWPVNCLVDGSNGKGSHVANAWGGKATGRGTWCDLPPQKQSVASQRQVTV